MIFLKSLLITRFDLNLSLPYYFIALTFIRTNYRIVEYADLSYIYESDCRVY